MKLFIVALAIFTSVFSVFMLGDVGASIVNALIMCASYFIIKDGE